MRAPNAVTRRVTDYGPDPRSPAAGAIHDARVRLHGFLVRVVGVADADPAQTFNGAIPHELQQFNGNAGANAVTNRDGGHPEISSALVEGPMGDPARRIFAARLRRGRA